MSQNDQNCRIVEDCICLQEPSSLEPEKSLSLSILTLLTHLECQGKWIWIGALALWFASRIARSDTVALLDFFVHWKRLCLIWGHFFDCSCVVCVVSKDCSKTNFASALFRFGCLGFPLYFRSLFSMFPRCR